MLILRKFLFLEPETCQQRYPTINKIAVIAVYNYVGGFDIR